MKELSIKHPELGENVLLLSLPTFLGNPKIIFNGKEITKTQKVYSISEYLGKPFDIKLKNTFIDHIPKVLINDEPIEIAKPLKWYEYVWMGLPIILALQGGALGAILGFFALRVNSSIFRSNKKTLKKYLASLGVNILITILFVLIAALVNEFVRGNK